MKTLFLFLLLLPLIVFCQNTNKSNIWDLPCDTLETQTGMNICSAQKLNIADSIMLALYDWILIQFETKYQLFASDTILVEDKQYVESLSNRIDFFKESQKLFSSYLSTFSNFVSENYHEASMKPLMVNSYALDLVADRIHTLESIQKSIIDDSRH